MKTAESSVALITGGNRGLGLQTARELSVAALPHAKLMRAIELLGTRVAPLVRTELASGTAKAPLDETRVEFDEEKVNRIVNDVRDHAHLNARRATQDKYE
jgi:NAD(P)-dependent dehydrogenase (short-subunit alcohol dehydrogenase family)